MLVHKLADEIAPMILAEDNVQTLGQDGLRVSWRIVARHCPTLPTLLHPDCRQHLLVALFAGWQALLFGNPSI